MAQSREISPSSSFILHPFEALPHIQSHPHIRAGRQPRHDLCQDPTQRRNILSRKPPRLPGLARWRMIGCPDRMPHAARLLRPSPRRRRRRFGPSGNLVRRRQRRRPKKKGIRMIRRRIAAVALAAGCLLSQAGCTGFGFGSSSTNNCPNTSSGCCLTSGGGIFSRMFGSPAPATACCPPTCAPPARRRRARRARS